MLPKKFILPNFYKQITPIITDVTLRYGWQQEIPLAKKQNLFHQIVSTYSPKYIEIHSLQHKNNSVKDDTKPMTQFANDYKNIYGNPTHYFTVVNSMNQLQQGINNQFTRFTFVTSISNAFQIHNCRKTILQTKKDLEIMNQVSKYIPNIYTKLHISCIDHCPFIGYIDINYALHEICKYHHNYSFDELCLSDTCGNLTFDNFKYLVECLYLFGVPKSKIGLHLHVKNVKELKKIVNYSLQNEITKYDLTILDSTSSKNDSQTMDYGLFMDIYNNLY